MPAIKSHIRYNAGSVPVAESRREFLAAALILQTVGNSVFCSLEENLADFYNGRMGSSGGETDGVLLILHVVKNCAVAPHQLQQ